MLMIMLRALLPIIAIALSGCQLAASSAAPSGRDSSKGSNIKFTYPSGNAVSVCVLGDFNGWSSTEDCLSKGKDGFKLEKRLGPGRYKYQLLIDSKIMTHDPKASISEDDGFGGKNSVLVVE